MFSVTLPLVLLLMFMFSTQENVRYCSLLWSVIFTYDYIIGSTFFYKDGYFLFTAMTSVMLLLSSAALEDRLKQTLISCVLFISFFLNLQEHFSYYQTWAYDFLKVYQWVSVEILLIILMWDKNNVQICRNNYKARGIIQK